MNSIIIFPENLVDFLYWIKETTETFWNKVPCEELIYGAKWQPLTDSQIDELELKYSITFDFEHRTFLRILHTIDKHYNEEEEEEKNEEYVLYKKTESEELKRVREFWYPPYRPSLFYNWITEKEWIESRLVWIENLFIKDILGVNKSWLKSWGPRPKSYEEQIQIFREWYQKAPRLLPIQAHTFLMAGDRYGLNPVMSVYGFDTIIAGWSLRHFLIRKFAEELGLSKISYDEDYPEGYSVLVKGISELDMLQTIRLDDTVIPYWKEVLTYYNYPGGKCWQGFLISGEESTL